MKKTMKKVLSFVIALALVLGSISLKAPTKASANASGAEIAINQGISYTGTAASGYTFDSSALGTSETVGAMVFNISIALPAEGDVAWNDWCGEFLSVTTADGVSYYDFGGAQVSWGVDANGDDVADTTGVGTASWVGSAANGACTVVVPVNAAEFKIDFFDNCWDSATDIDHIIINSATPIYGNVSGTETIAVGQGMSFTGSAAPGYTFASSSASAGKAAAVVFNVSIDLPAEGDVAWNDWCGEAAKVTTPDGTAFYDFGGAQVGWGVDVDGDTTTDTTGVGTDSWAGSAVNGTVALVIPVGAEEYTIDLYDNCWDSATDINHMTVNSATVVYGEGGPAAAASDAPELSAEQTAFLMFSDRNWNYGNWDSSLAAATTTVNGAGSYTVSLNAADVKGEATDPVTGAQVLCVDVVGGSAYYAQTGESLILEDIEVLCDGVPVAVDTAKIATGDIEENGNFRIEIYNEYGLTVGDAPIDFNAFTFNDNITINFTLSVGNPYAQETNACLIFTDRNWNYGNWDDSISSTKVLGDGTYTVTLNTADVKGEATDPVNGAQVFCVDILGLGNLVPDVTAIQASDVKVLCDGVEIPVDPSKVVFGDLEALGNFRIEIYNEYGTTVNDSPIDFTGLTFADTLAVTFTLSGINYGPKVVEEVEEIEFAGYSGNYNAYLQVQTDTSLWIFRNNWDDATYGLGTPEYDGGLYSTTSLEHYAGDFTNAVIDGDGTYTISLKGADFADETHFSMLCISTDIPYGGDAKFTDVTVKVNGKEMYVFDEGVINDENKNYVQIMCQNNWNNAVKDLFEPMFPVSDVEITFTVSGLGYEGTGAGAADAEPVVTTAPADNANTDTTKTEDTSNTAPTEPVAPAEPAEESSSNTGLIIGIIAAVVVVAAVVVFLVLKKKKSEK